MGQQNSTRPAILLNAPPQCLQGIQWRGDYGCSDSSLATPPSTKSASSLAPPGYTKPVPMASWSPKTPSRSRNMQALLAQNKTTRAKRVRASKDTISGSKDESQQTLPDATILNDDSAETPNTLYDAPTFEDGVLGAGSLEDRTDVVAKDNRLTSRKRRGVK
jgi:hypothetical protein